MKVPVRDRHHPANGSRDITYRRSRPVVSSSWRGPCGQVDRLSLGVSVVPHRFLIEGISLVACYRMGVSAGLPDPRTRVVVRHEQLLFHGLKYDISEE